MTNDEKKKLLLMVGGFAIAMVAITAFNQNKHVQKTLGLNKVVDFNVSANDPGSVTAFTSEGNAGGLESDGNITPTLRSAEELEQHKAKVTFSGNEKIMDNNSVLIGNINIGYDTNKVRTEVIYDEGEKDGIVRGQMIHFSDTTQSKSYITASIATSEEIYHDGEFPATIDDARAAIEDFDTAYDTSTVEWQVGEDHFVRILRGYDKTMASSCMIYMFFPKKTATDGRVYVASFYSSDGYPLTRTVYNTAVANLKQAVPDAQSFIEPFTDMEKHLEEYLFYKSADPQTGDSQLKTMKEAQKQSQEVYR